ncbi:MAG: DbpA RNA binding domain-containing protein [Treponema sp.]|nr:DbpA RNA binding domain-containing protein [Treponema sp.]
MYNRDSEIDMDSVALFLKDAVEKIKTQENPDILNDLKKVFKKNVPLTMRSYLAAYLIKDQMKHFHGQYRPRKDFKENKKAPRQMRERKPVITEETIQSEERQPRPRVQIDPSMAATIFISIGRNRRVFPRDLVGLLVGAAGLDRDRIGDIRVLANYSFVQLFAEDAEKAIAALNNYEYRGRSLSVSYSRQKDAEEDSQTAEGLDAQAAAEDAAAYAAAEKASSNEVFSAPHYSSSEEQPSDEGNTLV